MALLDAIPIVGPVLDAAAGIASEANARDAFKHRYQDTVADLKAAGLNPALAYGQGGGNPQTSDLPDIGSSLVRGISSAAAAKQAKAAADLTRSQSNLLNAQTADLVDQIRLRNKVLMADFQNVGAQAFKTTQEGNRSQLAFKRESATFDPDIQAQRDTDKLIGLRVPEQQAIAKFFNTTGGAGTTNAIQFGKLLLDILGRGK